MGTGRRVVVTGTGFPGTTKTINYLQDGTIAAFASLAKLLGENVILYGVEQIENSTNYTAGAVSLGGYILPFEAGQYNDFVTLIVETDYATYDADDNNDGVQDSKQAYERRYLKFGTHTGFSFEFAALKRLKTILELSEFALPDGVVIDNNYIPLTQAMVDKLAGIAEGAQVNVQANWNGAQGTPQAILNKPDDLARILKKSSLYVGDVISPGNQEFTVSFPNVGTSNYQVLVTFESSSESTAHASATLSYAVHSRTATSFKILVREFTGSTQALRIYYTILSL